MREMCKCITPYKCPVCNQDMLFFVLSNNNIVDYKRLLEEQSPNGIYSIREYLGNRNVKFIKCIVCNKTSIIDWSDTYPKPLLNNNILKEFGV